MVKHFRECFPDVSEVLVVRFGTFKTGGIDRSKDPPEIETELVKDSKYSNYLQCCFLNFVTQMI